MKHRVLHYSPVKASKIINACVILHNICIENNVIEPIFDDLNIEDEDLGLFENNNNVNDEQMRTVNPQLVAGREMQRQIIQRYFNA